GDQIRGFGYTHDGATDSLDRFMSNTGFSDIFNVHGFAIGDAGEQGRLQMVNFLLAFDSNLAPVVGQQVTLGRQRGTQVAARISLLIARAAVGECELVVKTVTANGRELGYLYDPAISRFVTDRAGQPTISDAALRQTAQDKHRDLTYTCVPPGSG